MKKIDLNDMDCKDESGKVAFNLARKTRIRTIDEILKILKEHKWYEHSEHGVHPLTVMHNRHIDCIIKRIKELKNSETYHVGYQSLKW